MSTRRRWAGPTVPVWALSVLAVLGCSGRSVVGGPEDSGAPASDRPTSNIDAADAAADSGNDAGADIGFDSPDTGPPPDVFSGCRTNADCSGNEFGYRVCNTMTNSCVECTAQSEMCGEGAYCDPTTNRCARGCRDDMACRAGTVAVDGGLADASAGPGLFCNPNTRTCVECVSNDQCPAGNLCMGNQCVRGCTDTSRCAAGESCCAGACVNTQDNTAHCGMCGTLCQAPNGEPACSMGRCVVGSCMGSFRDCDDNVGNGCETNTNNDLRHCGGCGRACEERPNTAASCAMGVCEYRCRDGFADCNMDPTDGCEVDLNNSPAHCGMCGNRCARDNATAACRNGTCALGACNEGFANCDMMEPNGCEVDTRTSTTHCGTCGTMCSAPSNGTSACANGSCSARCAMPFADCNGEAGDGCEANLNENVLHCGSCGNRCSIPNATGVCQMGACAIGACNDGFADCNMNPADGCETNLNASVASCGRCGNACRTPNASPACRNGTCAIGACNPGFADCNGNPADGCETVVNSDIANCGRCGNVCPRPSNGSPICTNGTCGIGACASGTADCDMNSANGCETTISNNLNNCGACGRMCPTPANGSAVCVGGVCSLGTCNTGFVDCDLNAANGCEVNVTTDVNNCGGCGRRCVAPTGGSVTCSAGACIQACPSGQLNCNGVCRASGSCTSAGTGGCQTTGSLSCSGTTTVCSATPRTSGACTTPVNGVCGSGGVCACAAGQTNCSGTCRALATDNANCGACGSVCTAPAGGSATCTGGTCVITCPAGQTNCGGTCRNLTADNANCGACGRACATNQACVAGVCVGQGSLRFTLTWDTNGDMDLHVLPPCGTEIYYGRLSACGGTLDRDDTSVRGPENVFWNSSYTPGRYYVCAESYSSAVSRANYTLTVVRNGVTVRTVTGNRGGVTDGNRACGPGFNQLTIDL
ncbi:MAG: hypothetical protein JNK72_22940 [Myxococcales bacterium]|nr:hypothetical protein [Myxococcales bacterium]